MEKIRIVAQNLSDIDRIEPLFYALLLFAFSVLLVVLVCTFCCLQQKQLEDFSFIENINQYLIDNDQSLLNLPKSKDKNLKQQGFKSDRIIKSSPKRHHRSIVVYPGNLNQEMPNPDQQINLPKSNQLKENFKSLNLIYRPLVFKDNNQPNTTSLFVPKFKEFKNDCNILNPKTVDLLPNDSCKRTVDSKLVAALRLKSLKGINKVLKK